MNDRFVVLTGHLNNYPLPDLIGILRHQRKSGRLLIEYAKGPATFFFILLTVVLTAFDVKRDAADTLTASFR